MYTKLPVQSKLSRLDSAINRAIYHIKANEGQNAIDVLLQVKEISEDIQTLINRETQS